MHQFNLQVPDDLWERFKSRAIQEYGSPRQAALALIKTFVESPEPTPKEGSRHAPDNS